MNKEGNDSAKKTRKDMDKTGGLKPRASLDTRPSPPPSKQPLPARSSALRPRPGSSSNLPKYRPKSIVVENGKKPSSPGLSGSRKRTLTSDDEDKTSSGDMAVDAPPQRRKSRPISPLSQCAAAKTKTSGDNSKSNTPKPESSPLVWKASRKWLGRLFYQQFILQFLLGVPSALRISKSDGKGRQGQGSVHSTLLESPLVRHVRQRSKAETPPAQNPGNMSHITEADSDDNEDHVEIMLAPIAAPGAPMPALPRLQTMRNHSRLVPATPSKPLLPIHFEPPRQLCLKTKIVLPSSDQTLHQVATAASAMNLSYRGHN
ncbi:hypothetical protein HHX47_DHR4001047 [Lentinula edodes]|nr:hypothetical protein HHX47_DHR4001047 [Lentinula edodes]